VSAGAQAGTRNPGAAAAMVSTEGSASGPEGLASAQEETAQEETAPEDTAPEDRALEGRARKDSAPEDSGQDDGAQDDLASAGQDAVLAASAGQDDLASAGQDAVLAASAGQDDLASSGQDAVLADGGPQDVVLILQRHLLPAGLPIFPQVRLAGRHLVAAREPGGGGFDAFALAGGTIALMVARVPGHGPEAVAAMSELRSVLRQALHGGAGLDEALKRADLFAARSPATRGATACIALLAPATGSLRYASAGHAMPLICAAAESSGAGTISILPPTDDKPLGLGAEQPAIATAEVGPDTVLLLGCGAGGKNGQTGTERFVAAAGAVLGAGLASAGLSGAGLSGAGLAGAGLAGAGPPGARLAGSGLAGAGTTEVSLDGMSATVAEHLADGGLDGDVTVLAAYRLREPDPGLSLRLPAEATALRQLRAQLADWLEGLGASPLDRVDTELAVYEAAANAIVHGRPARGEATVTASVRLDGTDGVLIEVVDQGRWQPRAGGTGEERPGGRGLSVISKVTDELSIIPSPDGTTVIMRRGLTHPVAVERAPER
jgi:anti-sigma regulatory factor (Ser/Thr protein kinase)